MWTVQSRDHTKRKDGGRYWLVQCDCGHLTSVAGRRLTDGGSSGCRTCRTFVKHGGCRGGRFTTEYTAYSAMLSRVKHNPLYAKITIDPSWLGPDGFKIFLLQMGDRPIDKTSLGRLDNSGPYSRANCCWQDQTEQMNNTHRSTDITVGGVTLTGTQWERRLGYSPTVISGRRQRGMSPEEAVLAGKTIPHPRREIARLKAILDAHGIKY